MKHKTSITSCWTRFISSVSGRWGFVKLIWSRRECFYCRHLVSAVGHAGDGDMACAVIPRFDQGEPSVASVELHGLDVMRRKPPPGPGAPQIVR